MTSHPTWWSAAVKTSAVRAGSLLVVLIVSLVAFVMLMTTLRRAPVNTTEPPARASEKQVGKAGTSFLSHRLIAASSIISDLDPLPATDSPGYLVALDNNIHLLSSVLPVYEDNSEITASKVRSCVGQLRAIGLLDQAVIARLYDPDTVEATCANIVNQNWGSREVSIRLAVSRLLEAVNEAAYSRSQLGTIKGRLEVLRALKGRSEQQTTWGQIP